MTSLEIKNLSITLGSRRIINNLDLNITSGAIASLLGPSGCGKTTLLRAIAGLIQPETGTIRLGSQLIGVSSVFLPPEKRNIGYVPQNSTLFPHLSVEKNIAFGLRKDRYTKQEIQDAVSEMLHLIGMEHLGKRMPTELSGGQQTRVALARALAVKPHLVLLDEPFSALDAQLRNELRTEVVSLLRKRNATAILVTHDREEALVSSDQIVLMRDGTVMQTGTPEEVYSSPISAEVASSVGDVVIVNAQVAEDGKAASIFGNSTLAREMLIKRASKGFLVIRPEEIKVSRNQNPDSAKGVIKAIEYYGHDAMLQIEVEPKTSVAARISGPLDFNLGETVWLSHEGPVRFFPTSEGERI